MANKKAGLDLSDLLPDDFVPTPLKKRQEVGIEVVYHWTNFNCSCGTQHHAPTYGASPMVKFEIQRLGVGGRTYKHDSFVYYPLGAADSYRNLPRNIEVTTIEILSCPSCIHRYHISEDQLQLFPEREPNSLPEFSSPDFDLALFESALEVKAIKLDDIEEAKYAQVDSISFFVDKETN